MDEFSEEMITISTPGIVTSFIFELSLPIILSFIWVKNFNGRIKCILIGILGFIFSVALETIFLTIVTYYVDKKSNIFYMFTALSPGFFEETGKYILLKYLSSEDKSKIISVSYGIGHGGIECIIIGFSFLSYIFAKDSLIEKRVLKESITFMTGIMSSSERFFALMLQISLSIIDFKAVKEKNINYYFQGIILHDLIDIIPLLKLKGVLTSILLIEFIVGIYSLCIFLYSYNLYNNFEEEKIKKKKRYPYKGRKSH